VKIICLTGGLASGKSTAVTYLAKQGADVIDADLLGHQAYNPGTDAFDSVVRTFGEDVLGDDGQINRKVLGGKVFAQPEELKKLTNIVWPEIRRLAELEMSEIQQKNPDAIIVLEAAVLFEAGWEDMGEEIWVVTVDREKAIARSMERDQAPRDAVENRLNAQLSNEERTSRADIIITNDGSKDDLIAQLSGAWTSSTG
jgi:phosphopantetheine adenylyltransferase/dephospho-CoA kinase